MLREASILSEFPKYSIRKFSMACGSAATRKMFDRRIFHEASTSEWIFE
jgi:hypothetical protein